MATPWTTYSSSGFIFCLYLLTSSCLGCLSSAASENIFPSFRIDPDTKRVMYYPSGSALSGTSSTEYKYGGDAAASSCDVLGTVHEKSLVDWGLTLPDNANFTDCSTPGKECFDFGAAQLVVTVEDHCKLLQWTTEELAELKDCVNLDGHWYGGGYQYSQPWPVEKLPRKEVAYVTADVLQNNDSYGGVSEAYWVSSLGVALKVNDEVPLFLSLPDRDGDGKADQICLSTKYQLPFVQEPGTALGLKYHLCQASNVREVHEQSYPKFFNPPASIPDRRMISYPIWSTWAEYKAHINESKVLEMAQAIQDNGFNNSQLEIDDRWETCYGDAIFDPLKFPDPKGLVDSLHAKGFRVTLWIHPFINHDCRSFKYADELGYFVKNASGVTQRTRWWNGQNAGILDFTNVKAAEWWKRRLADLQAKTGVDSFKFDAGESSWLPKDYTLSLKKTLWPSGYTTVFSNELSTFDDLLEVRVGHGTQINGRFVRMLDKDSRWGYDNGLKTMVSSLLHSGLIGYPFSLPDMIGGNNYGTPKVSPELFIRWAQCSAFMPSMQFSLFPWEFGEQSELVVNRSLDVTRIHAEFAPLIIELAQSATKTGIPMMRPTWWLCPTTESCLNADQQFLLGDDYIIAPIVDEGATTLKVTLPMGKWKLSSGSGQIYDITSDGTTITVPDITINSIIYFKKVY